jgi:DNA polymerase I-like protein with 3'-5' exonuclease and polymerase domains
MHDEAQADVVNRHVDIYLYLAKESIVQAGQLLKLNVPLAADAVAGNNWAETH